MNDITGILNLNGSAFAPMIAIKIADFFLLKRDRSGERVSLRNLLIGVRGFVAYRWLMGVDFILGCTLADMALTLALCLAAEKLLGTRKR